MAGNAKLTGGAVTFVTADENRDWDTGIDVSVQTPEGAEVASLSVPFGEFKDGTTAGPYPLDVLTDVGQDDVSGGTATVTIHPHGNDTWRFDFRLRLRFADATHIGLGSVNDALDQDRNSAQFALGNPPN